MEVQLSYDQRPMKFDTVDVFFLHQLSPHTFQTIHRTFCFCFSVEREKSTAIHIHTHTHGETKFQPANKYVSQTQFIYLGKWNANETANVRTLVYMRYPGQMDALWWFVLDAFVLSEIEFIC